MTDPFGRFLLPGPTEVHPEVLAALGRPMIPHRGRDMVSLLEGVAGPLRDLFRTQRRVLVGTCSATGFMEMAVRCGVRQRVLSLVGGAFGERFAGIARACGHDVVRLDVNLGETVEPDMLRDALKRTEVDAVTMVHSETATGALAPLAELAQVVREFDDIVLLVDAVTSLAGSPVETDAWGMDFVLTGSQKALALPPGLAFGVANERFLERARKAHVRGAYLDVLAYEEAFASNQPTNTPAISLLYALDVQLRRIAAAGGVTARWERHKGMLETVERWALGIGGRAAAHRLAEQGWVIGSGYGALKEDTIRIGHMGDHTIESVQQVLGLLEEVGP